MIREPSRECSYQQCRWRGVPTGNRWVDQVMCTMEELKGLLEDRRKMANDRATAFREARDKWNEQSKIHKEQRTLKNDAVRELIDGLRKQREVRDSLNETARELRKQRDEWVAKIQEYKASMADLETGGVIIEQIQKGHRTIERRWTIPTIRRDAEEGDALPAREDRSGQEEGRAACGRRNSLECQGIEGPRDRQCRTQDLRVQMTEAMEAQEEAPTVRGARGNANRAHEQYMEWGREVEAERELAEKAHRELRRTKKEADDAHHHYIVAIRCLHSSREILVAMDQERSGKVEATGSGRQEMSDLMERLMAGETLSTEEFMSLQRFD